MTEPLPIPPGCAPAPGFILTIPGGWLRADGTPTDIWRERGVWATQELADQAIEDFFADELP